MRFEDWDILLFPRDSKVPMKEFKVACHVVQDHEFSHAHGCYGIPTLSCFVPSLTAGTRFRISIHSWTPPRISQTTKAYTQHLEHMKFEARLFIDGRLIAYGLKTWLAIQEGAKLMLNSSTWLDQNSGWPHVMAHSYEFSKNGDLEPLRFPFFQKELLEQSHWSPGDDLGRIKIVISEGFPRDSLSMPLERVKNLVAFSFQHAPLSILETASIAWPNQSMWKRSPCPDYMLPVPTQQANSVESHAHSPRRRAGRQNQKASSMYSGENCQTFPPKTSADGLAIRNRELVQRNLYFGGTQRGSHQDSLGSSSPGFEWLDATSMPMDDVQMTDKTSTVTSRKPRGSATDESMPDYVPTNPKDHSRFYFGNAQFPEDLQVGQMKVPTNTPTARPQKMGESELTFPILPHNSIMTAELAHSLTTSLLNQPPPLKVQSSNTQSSAEVRSRKENRFQQPTFANPTASSSHSTPRQDHTELRRVSQQMYLPSGGSTPVGMLQHQNQSPKILSSSDAGHRASPQGQSRHDVSSLLVTQDSSSVDGTLGSTASSENGLKGSQPFLATSPTGIEEVEPVTGSPIEGLSPFPRATPLPPTTQD